MSIVVYADLEDCVCDWVKSLTLPATPKIMLAPKEIPLPSITMARVGGAPSSITVDEGRISFDVWSSTRPTCKAIAKALVSEIESLQFRPVLSFSSGLLHGGEVISWLWLPDNQPDPPIARYVIDALFTVTNS